MLRLDVNGTPLLLPANATAQVTYRNPKLAEGIVDDYTLPLDLPVRGNEAALGHVHELALRSRTLELRPAHLHHQGVPLHPGSLQVLGSTSDTVRASFSAQGFASTVKGVRLRDALAGNAINTEADGGPAVHAKLVTMRPTPHPSHCFPLHSNPSLYGAANPQWKPSANAWSPTEAYALDALVSFMEYEPVRREYLYQCVAATSPGEAPNDSPKWRRVVFGLVNSYDVDAEAYDTNGAAGNFYALVPWFRYDWVVRQALAHLGLQARGDWFADPATPYYVMPNATPLDAEQRLGEWAARQTVPITIGPTDHPYKLPLDNDASPPFIDPNNLYDTTARTFTCAGAGTHRFRVFIRAVFSSADFLSLTVRRASDNTVITRGRRQVPVRINTPGSATNHAFLFEFDAPFRPADVGQQFYLSAEPLNARSYITTVEFQESWATSWRQSPSGTNGYRNTIDPAQHVPDLPLGEFLEAVATTFGLEVVPDLERSVVYFNLKERLLRANTASGSQAANRHQRTTDITHLQAAPLELDHNRRITGLSYRWPVANAVEQEPPNSERTATVDHMLQLAKPTGPRQHALVRSTRTLVRSVWDSTTSQYVWTEAGTLMPPVSTGAASTADATEWPMRPLPMDEVWVDGRRLLVPVLDLAGTSSFYAQEGGQLDLHVCVNHGPVATREDGLPYPAAASWGLDQSGAARWGLLLQDQPEGRYPSWWDHHHARWADALVRSEPVTTDLLLGPELLRDARRRNDLLHLAGHTLLLEELPVEYANSRAPLVSRGAYLRRIPPAPFGQREPKVYVLPGCPHITGQFSFVIPEGWTEDDLLFILTDQVYDPEEPMPYMAVVQPDGQKHIVPADAGGFYMPGNEAPLGAWCVYPCTADGTPEDRGFPEIQAGNLSGTAKTQETNMMRCTTTVNFNLFFMDNLQLPWADLNGLETFSATGCNLETLPVVAGKESLKYLLVEYSDLTAVPDLTGCTSLSLLSLIGNAIADSDTAFVQMESLGLEPGYGLVSMQGGTNAPVTSASLAARNALLARGYTLQFNT